VLWHCNNRKISLIRTQLSRANTLETICGLGPGATPA
jgi:hypothetical protein